MLSLPALTLREEQDRLDSFGEAAVMMVGLDTGRIKEAISVLADESRDPERTQRMVANHPRDNVAEKALRIFRFVNFRDRRKS